MNKKKFISTAQDVINLEIKALQDLKKNINNSFNKAVVQIAKCQSKVILCGVGKSGLIAAKIAATLASVGTPSFNISASEASHGDLGMISKKDILILISNSGETKELKNIIQYVNRNKILLVGIVSKKDSILYKASDIKLLLPSVREAAGIVPTSSTISQLALGDALAIATMKYKKFGKLDFKRLHPAGSLGAQLKTVEDIMITGSKIPFVRENSNMKDALGVINKKGLGVLLIKKKNVTTGILTDSDLKRLNRKYENLKELKIKKVMKKKPISIDKDALAAQALSIMNTKKITSLCVHKGNQKNKTVGIIHIHNILKANIN